VAKTYTLIFRTAWGAYNAGERAGFEADEAKSLIKAGFALPVDAKAAIAAGIMGRPDAGPVTKPPVSAAVTAPPAARSEANADGDGLEDLKYQELLTRAKGVADERGETLPASKKTDSLIAFIREGAD
jgi:hypothetical protein